jgi:hypothetical protein
MFRLLGFLIGSVAALTIILIVLGVPDFHLTDRGIDQQRFDAAVKKLKEKQQEVATVAEEIADEVADSVTDVRNNAEVVLDTPLADVATQAVEDGVSKHEPDELPPDAPELVKELPAVQEEAQWYSFWNPFRSEIAARGFVTQLEKVTGLDYRVVKVKTGVYEVAFAYNNDSERRTKLSQISAATGLDLPDS